jgi:prephenate dehydrogenase
MLARRAHAVRHFSTRGSLLAWGRCAERQTGSPLGSHDFEHHGALPPALIGVSADVTAVLEGVHERIGAVLDALRGDTPAVTLAELLTAGNTGVARIPGKHGRSAHFAHILVVIDDRPGQLAQLLADIGELGINMEDLRLEHSPGSAIGFAEVSVLAAAEATLVRELEVRGWRIAGEGQ